MEHGRQDYERVIDLWVRNERDRTAREAYRRNSAEADLDGLFMRDIIREKVTNDDPRL